MIEVYRRRKDSPDSPWHSNTQCPDWPELDYIQSRYLSPDESARICRQCRTLNDKMFPSQTLSPRGILSTTTSPQDSGLLDVLAPLFEKQTGYSVKTVSLGTGQALALAAKGGADVALVHAPTLEKQYVSEGKLLNRRLVMYNDFVIIGPKDDPANVRLTKSALEALRRIEQANANFVSRGNNSGTHVFEKSLWKAAGIDPRGRWYIETRQGMGATLGIANERNAYTITDRGTYLALHNGASLSILIEGDRALLNIYSVMEVNPANGPCINTVGGKAFADFMVAPQTQNVIRNFGVEKFGQSLFVPVAGKKDDELGG